LVFTQNYDLEQSSATVAFDNGLLEISINGGAFNDIVLAGGSFVTGGYDHTSISTSFRTRAVCSMGVPSRTGAAFPMVSEPCRLICLHLE
jgi:hypothetical protein